MDRADYGSNNCSVARSLAIIGDRWTMLVLREAFWGVKRFDRLQSNLGIARNILADRLQKLVANDILERTRYQERPERFEYRLTQKGVDLWPAIVALLEWGDRYVADEDTPPVVLVHEECGHDADPRMTCSHCGEQVTARDIKPELRPGIHTHAA
jgi:DNA-binding HxlR family transcriptional regulator